MKNAGEKDNCETKNRIKELENLVEKKTRTERHLEEYGDSSRDESVEMAKDKQRRRESSINDLENTIIYGDGGPTPEKENLEKRIQYSEGYLSQNGEHMDETDLENLKNKIENKKDTLRTF